MLDIETFKNYLEDHFKMKFTESSCYEFTYYLNPEEVDEDMYEEAYMGFRIEDRQPKVWQPDWININDDDYYGGEWIVVNSIEEVKDYIKRIPIEREEWLKAITVE